MTTRKHASAALERKFKELADSWHDETDVLSSPQQMAEHPAYQLIIAEGEAVVPLILEDLRTRGSFWYEALRTITGANPVDPKDAGVVPNMKASWLRWGRDHNYID